VDIGKGKAQPNSSGSSNISHSSHLRSFCVYLLVIFAGLWAAQSQGIGLGDVRLISYIGEPFSAEVSVVFSEDDDIDRTTASIANAEKHADLGINYNGYIRYLTVEIIPVGNGHVITIASNEIMRDVFLEFVLELRSISGGVSRAYTVLPDFARYKGGSPTQEAKAMVPTLLAALPSAESTTRSSMAIPSPQQASIADPSSPAASAPASSLKPASQPITAGTYQVRSLDSIWKIAAGMDRGLGSISDRMQLLRISNPILQQRQLYPGDQLTIAQDATSLASYDLELVEQLDFNLSDNATNDSASNPTTAQRSEGAGVLEISMGEADYSAAEFNTESAEVGDAQGSASGNGSTDVYSELRAINDVSLITARRITELTLQLSEVQQRLAQMEAQGQQLTELLKRIGSQPGFVDPIAGMTTTNQTDSNSWVWVAGLALVLLILIAAGIFVWLVKRREDAHDDRIERRAPPPLTAGLATPADPDKTISSVTAPQQAYAGPASDQPVTVSHAPVENTSVENAPVDNTSAFAETISVDSRNRQDLATVSVEISGEDCGEPSTLDAYSVDVNMGHVPTLEPETEVELELDIDLDLDVDLDLDLDLGFELGEDDVLSELDVSNLTNDLDAADDAAARPASNVMPIGQERRAGVDVIARWKELAQEWAQAVVDVPADNVLAMLYIDLDATDALQKLHGSTGALALAEQADILLRKAAAGLGKTLHHIGDYSFAFLLQGLSEDDLSHQGEMLAALIRGHSFKIAELDQELTASVAIVPFTPLFTSLDAYLLNAKGTIALLRASKQLDGRGDGVVMKNFENSEDWQDEDIFLSKVDALLRDNKFEVHYQTLVNLGGSCEQVYLCKTELSAEAGGKFELEDGFLKKAFSCRATPQIERQSINSFLDKIQSLNADKFRILFRIDIRSAMDSQFEDWLFQQLADKKVSPGSVGLFIYIDDAVAHKREIVRFAASLRSKGVVLGLLNVDYTPEHAQAVIDVGAGLIRISPSIIDDILSVSAQYGSGEGGRRTRESTQLCDFLKSFHSQGVETVLFTTYAEAIPELVVINASKLHATYIQTPVGLIEDDPYNAEAGS
jgi:GGDEF domain-containing protein/EAL domain-containing protein (putative c-di-GMP-specific phosphodiesterase class I)